MRFEHVVRLPVSRSTAWPRVTDVPAVARCMPGVEALTANGDDRYRGAVRVSVGPVRLRLEGDVVVTKLDEAAGEAVLRLEAADKGIGGNVRADLSLKLVEVDGGTASDLLMTTEATLAGRIGDLGQPIVKRKADQVMAEFAKCLARSLGSAS